MIPPKRLYMDIQSGSGIAKANLDLHKDASHIIVRKSKSSDLTETDIPAQEEECVTCLKAIADVENLTKLDLVDFEGGNLPIRGLTAVFQTAPKLKALRIDSVFISGTRLDFAQFITSLQSHSSLSEIHLIGCLPSRETQMIQGMAEALARLKSLRIVEIVETKYAPYGSWTGEALAALCSSPYLKTLRVRGVRFLRDEHLVLSAKALKHNQSIQELSFLCDIGEKAVQALCEMLVVNQSLQVVSLNRIMEGKQSSEIAQALMFNTSVRELHLYFRYCVIDHLRTSFLELMEKNYTLEKLAGGWACNNLEVFLRLNKAGRKRVLGVDAKASRSDWVDLMASQRDDVQGLFYLVSQNPAICCQE